MYHTTAPHSVSFFPFPSIRLFSSLLVSLSSPSSPPNSVAIDTSTSCTYASSPHPSSLLSRLVSSRLVSPSISNRISYTLLGTHNAPKKGSRPPNHIPHTFPSLFSFSPFIFLYFYISQHVSVSLRSLSFPRPDSERKRKSCPVCTYTRLRTPSDCFVCFSIFVIPLLHANR